MRSLDGIPALWIVWALYWAYASRGMPPDRWRESRRSRLVHTVPLIAAFVLLSPGGTMSRFASVAPFAAPAATALGAALTAAGLAWAAWARARLGGHWSGAVALKPQHELVTSGPYAIVRHPIYAGVALAFVGTAIAEGRWRGLAAVALAAFAVARRVRVEEVVLRREFGASYERYAARVAAVVPMPCRRDR